MQGYGVWATVFTGARFIEDDLACRAWAAAAVDAPPFAAVGANTTWEVAPEAFQEPFCTALPGWFATGVPFPRRCKFTAGGDIVAAAFRRNGELVGDLLGGCAEAACAAAGGATPGCAEAGCPEAEVACKLPGVGVGGEAVGAPNEPAAESAR